MPRQRSGETPDHRSRLGRDTRALDPSGVAPSFGPEMRPWRKDASCRKNARGSIDPGRRWLGVVKAGRGLAVVRRHDCLDKLEPIPGGWGCSRPPSPNRATAPREEGNADLAAGEGAVRDVCDPGPPAEDRSLHRLLRRADHPDSLTAWLAASGQARPPRWPGLSRRSSPARCRGRRRRPCGSPNALSTRIQATDGDFT